MNSIEIDFLPVGNGEKSGDAIAFRYGNFDDIQNQHIIVIDGGTIESGKALVEHINKYYGGQVDLAILTHPDGDHASGLREVLNNLEVGEFWLHRPWTHCKEIMDLFIDGRITSNSLSQRIKDSYNYAFELEEIAISKKITIKEPFAGLTFDNGAIKVLGPTEEFYNSLIPLFTKTPESKTILERAYRGITGVVKWIQETWNIETLGEDGETTAENNSSCVILFEFCNGKFLFTGDAGIPALKNVIDYAENNSIDIFNLSLFQVPHHGSKRNISPSILNKIKSQNAYISSSANDPKHPAKKVVNALIRRGTSVYSTEGMIIYYHLNCNLRENYGPAIPLPFYDLVEE